jgi:hypothetical protein
MYRPYIPTTPGTNYVANVLTHNGYEGMRAGVNE